MDNPSQGPIYLKYMYIELVNLLNIWQTKPPLKEYLNNLFSYNL